MKIAVIGGGFSGLSISYLLLKKLRGTGKNIELYLFERENSVGGKIQTERLDGFLIENGPNGFLSSKPETIEIIKLLGIESELYEAEKSAEKRYILKRGKLVEVPLNPFDFIKSPILSPYGKLRILFEFFKGKGDKDDETVRDFVIRRLGKEAYERLIDPMVSGIYAGNPEKMEMRASFPVIYNLEKNYGGLLRGMFKIKKERKDVSASPSGRLTTFKMGLSFFMKRLREEILSLDGKIVLNSEVMEIGKKHGKIELFSKNGSFLFDKVILSVPSFECERIIKKIDPDFSDMLKNVLYSPIVVVHFGYMKKDLPSNFEGFGFLSPYIESRKILGSIFISSIFKKGRTPKETFLFTVMMGGARWMDVCDLNEKEIEEIVKEEFKELLNIRHEPVFKKVVKWERGIPQYNVGHSKIMEYASNFHKKEKNIFISGNAFRGIGINDISKASFLVVEDILKDLM